MVNKTFYSREVPLGFQTSSHKDSRTVIARAHAASPETLNKAIIALALEDIEPHVFMERVEGLIEHPSNMEPSLVSYSAKNRDALKRLQEREAQRTK